MEMPRYKDHCPKCRTPLMPIYANKFFWTHEDYPHRRQKWVRLDPLYWCETCRVILKAGPYREPVVLYELPEKV